MNNAGRRGYFDLSSIILLGVVTLLLVSLPGGCGSDDTVAEDSSEPAVEDNAEPTAPPMMEIVRPDPSDIDLSPPEQTDPESGADSDEGQVTGPEQQAADGTYVVQPGDTLHGIAVRFNVSLEVLMQLNNITDPNQLQVGQTLQLPN